jgi:hypothetical protein
MRGVPLHGEREHHGERRRGGNTRRQRQFPPPGPQARLHGGLHSLKSRGEDARIKGWRGRHFAFGASLAVVAREGRVAGRVVVFGHSRSFSEWRSLPMA